MPSASNQSDAVDIVAEFVRLWSQGDLDTAFMFLHDDCEYSLHLSDDLIAIGGVKAGKATIEPALRQIRDVFDIWSGGPSRFPRAMRTCVFSWNSCTGISRAGSCWAETAALSSR